jgi:penicillin amidase
MIPDGYPYRVGYEWAPPYRFRRITGELASARDQGQKLSREDLEHLQTDVLSLPARELIGLLRSAVAAHPDANAQLLLEWDEMLTRDSAAAALYEIWLAELTHELVKKAAPQTVWAILADWSLPLVLENLSRPSPETFGPNPAQARDHLLLETLEKAAAALGQRQGSDLAKWSWGTLHLVRFRHPLDQTLDPTLVQNLAATALLDPGPLPRPGDEYTVNATGFFGSSYDQVSGASYREILDLSHWDHSRAVNAPGQSGQPGSPHYSDLLPLWDAGKYFPLVYSRAAVEKAARERLVLEPN